MIMTIPTFYEWLQQRNMAGACLYCDEPGVPHNSKCPSCGAQLSLRISPWTTMGELKAAAKKNGYGIALVTVPLEDAHGCDQDNTESERRSSGTGGAGDQPYDQPTA